jgi:hypothetical protein
MALNIQNALLESQDESKSQNNAENLKRSVECLLYIHPGRKGYEIDNLLLSEVLNTDDRSRAYLNFNDMLGGKIIRGKRSTEYKTSCKFDPDIMED